MNEETGGKAETAEKAEATKVDATDAVALLSADHRKVEELFEKYKTLSTPEEKRKTAREIGKELIVHAMLEEEIFYPACRQTGVQTSSMDEAQVEHDTAKLLIGELLEQSATEEFYDAKVTVLSEYIKHHVGEEENPSDGIFAKAQAAGADMNALGQSLAARKTQLMGEADSLERNPPKPRSLHVETTRKSYQENNEMSSYSNDRQRNEQGRFTSDHDRDQGRQGTRVGWSHMDDDRSRGSSGGRERDQNGRFMSDDDHNGGRSGSQSRHGQGGGQRGGSGNDRERDDQGRFMSDDDHNGGRSGSQSRYGQGGGQRGGSGNDRERDDHGRFTSDDDHNGSQSRYGQGGGQRGDNDRDENGRFTGGGRDSSGGRDYGRDTSSGGQGWHGDSEGHSQAARMGWENRGSMHNQGNGNRDNDRGYSSRQGSHDDDQRGSQSHGGWRGDPEGHAEAARRGWRNRD